MDLFWLVASLLALAALLGLLVRVVQDDGLGHRAPPRSHPEDAAHAPTADLAPR